MFFQHANDSNHVGREAVFLRDRSALLKLRLTALKSNQCASLKNKYYCPEVFLDVVSSKLTSTAVLFLNVELLSEFFYQFPRELDQRLGRGLSKEQVEKLAREDKKVERHLEVIRRKELLELVLGKMDGLRDLRELDGGVEGGRRGLRPKGKNGRETKNGREGRERGEGRNGNGNGGWSLF